MASIVSIPQWLYSWDDPQFLWGTLFTDVTRNIELLAKTLNHIISSATVVTAGNYMICLWRNHFNDK